MADEEHDHNHVPEEAPLEDETVAAEGELDADKNAADELAALRAERDEYHERAMRTQAELENFRKRVNRERASDVRYQAASIAKDLLPVIDNLDRALDAAGQTSDLEALVQGIDMVRRQFHETLTRHDVHTIPATGEMFDPNRHEAVSQIPTAEQPPMTIVQEVERGYLLHDRILRPSKVIVAAAPAEK